MEIPHPPATPASEIIVEANSDYEICIKSSNDLIAKVMGIPIETIASRSDEWGRVLRTKFSLPDESGEGSPILTLICWQISDTESVGTYIDTRAVVSS